MSTELDPSSSVSFSLIPMLIAIGSALIGSVFFVWRLILKENSSSKDLAIEKRFQSEAEKISLALDNKIKELYRDIKDVDERRINSSSRIHEKLKDLELEMQNMEGTLTREVSLFRITEKSILDRLDKLETQYEKLNESINSQSGKIDAQADVLQLIYKEVSKA